MITSTNKDGDLDAAESSQLGSELAQPEDQAASGTEFSAFFRLMADIGRYGEEKYGDQSLQARIRRGDLERTERLNLGSLIAHSTEHCYAYLDGERHDHFGTLEHQLAAAAFNLMMEFYLSGPEVSR